MLMTVVVVVLTVGAFILGAVLPCPSLPNISAYLQSNASIAGMDYTSKSLFLAQTGNSTFIPCNKTLANIYNTQYPHNWTEEQLQWKQAARGILVEAKNILDEMGIPFFLAAMLGWYRQCDLVHYMNDLHIGIMGKDYKPGFREAFEKKGFKVKLWLGRVNDSLEVSLVANGTKIDVFFHYPDTDGVLYLMGCDVYSATKYKFRWTNFSLCWTEFLGLKVRIPCPTLPYIEHGPC